MKKLSALMRTAGFAAATLACAALAQPAGAQAPS
jgi:hypothetical protein